MLTIKTWLYKFVSHEKHWTLVIHFLSSQSTPVPIPSQEAIGPSKPSETPGRHHPQPKKVTYAPERDLVRATELSGDNVTSYLSAWALVLNFFCYELTLWISMVLQCFFTDAHNVWLVKDALILVNFYVCNNHYKLCVLKASLLHSSWCMCSYSRAEAKFQWK